MLPGRPMINYVLRQVRAFRADRSGNIALSFALFSIPTMLITGAAIDYALLNRAATRLQVAVDHAVLNSVKQNGDRKLLATSFFEAAYENQGGAGKPLLSFTESGGSFSLSVTATIETAVMKLAGIPSLNITRTATGSTWTKSIPGITDMSCLASGDGDGNANADSLVLDGTASASLTGCKLRSNASINCGGVDTGSSAVATGAVTGCANPIVAQQSIPGIYSSVAAQAENHCGTTSAAVTWFAGEAKPGGPNVIEVAHPGYTALHVCGSLTLQGELEINSPAVSDLVVVVENGGLIVATGANINAAQTTFVLAGSVAHPVIEFAGTDSEQSAFSVSASTNAANPWRGIAVYQASSGSMVANATWRSGATLIADGVVYLPLTVLAIKGVIRSGATGCTRVQAAQIVLSGSAILGQSAASCSALGVTQYTSPATTTVYSHLVK